VTVTYFTPPRGAGGRTMAGSNAPGAFLVTYENISLKEKRQGNSCANKIDIY